MLLSFTKDTKSLNKKLTSFIQTENFKLQTPIKDILQLIPEENKDLYLYTLNKAYKVLKQELVKNNKFVDIYLHTYIYVMELLIKEGKEESDIILDLYMAKLGYVKMTSLINYPVKLKTTEDFVMLLPKLDISTQQELLKVAEEQEKRINKEEKEKQDKEKLDKELKEKEAKEKENAIYEKKYKLKRRLLSILYYAIGLALLFVSLYFTARVIKFVNCLSCLENWDTGIDKYGAKSSAWIGPVISVLATGMLILGATKDDSAFGALVMGFAFIVPTTIGCANLIACSEIIALPIIVLSITSNILLLYFKTKK